MRRRLLQASGVIAVIAFAVWLNNSSLLVPADDARTALLAHRGVHQTYHREGLTNETCTAQRIDPPAHGFIENTLASMEAAFRHGADVVEFDIHPTTDGQFAVFHDWTLDCRTDGRGVTREQPMAALKALDIGYGYTADGGRTFPLRGKGIGLIPTLDEVLERFPGKALLINIKSNDPAEGELLAARLAQLSPAARARLMAYGGERPIERLKARLPDLPTMSRASLKRCLLRYFGLGWTGYVPDACRNSLLLLPVNIAPWVWGYPDRLSARMRAAGTQIFVTGPYGSGDVGASGVDDAETVARLPRPFSGGIWTNRIETIGPLLRN